MSAPGSSSLSTSAGASASEGTIADAIAGEIPFEITYDPADILASNTYTLSARIEDEEGYLLFINDTSIPAVTGGAPVTDIEVVVIDVRPPAEPRVIELEADAAIRFLDANGQQVREIPVTPGETVVFRIRNTAGLDHSFWIGTDEELSVVGKKTDIGVGPWSKGGARGRVDRPRGHLRPDVRLHGPRALLHDAGKLHGRRVTSGPPPILRD